MNNFRELECEALEELKNYLQLHPQLSPLQQYVEERLEKAGQNAEKRMEVMMELISFNLYMELIPEFNKLKEYVVKIQEIQASQKAS